MRHAAGILLSVTSLPSRYGIGCFDQAAYDFIDYLAEAGQCCWQILPLGPTVHGAGADSPYQSYSAFAGNPYLISLEALIEKGYLTRTECDAIRWEGKDGQVDYEKLYNFRYELLHMAYERSHIAEDPEYQKFRYENGWWLSDYALFMALKDFFGGVMWTQWPEDIRLRWDNALEYYHRKLYFDVEFQMFLQFEFFTQWRKLKAYAATKHINIVGDMPIYVSMDSADVWTNPRLFQLNEKNEATDISGCPPDAFSADGQVWGNPLYRWDYHKETGYQWWVTRLWASFQMFDVVRIDHFRGFEAYFSIPADTRKATEGHWEIGPGMDLFRTVEERLGRKSVIAEDLGLITENVRKLVKDSGFPNMKVLEFAFDENDTEFTGDYLPHNYPENCVVYTGTHDNETAIGWFKGLSPKLKNLVREYLCAESIPDEKINHSLIAHVMMSRAATCIIPLQDYLGLDNEARMNKPGTIEGNWSWRVSREMLSEDLKKTILRTTTLYGRQNMKNRELYQ